MTQPSLIHYIEAVAKSGDWRVVTMAITQPSLAMEPAFVGFDGISLIKPWWWW